MLSEFLVVMQTCIMAGCDFVKALPGIGIKKAHKHLRRLRSFIRVRYASHAFSLVVSLYKLYMMTADCSFSSNH